MNNRDYDVFLRKMKRLVREKAGGEARVCIFPVRKNNSILLDGLALLEKGRNLAPVLYLAPYYRAYQAGEGEEELAEQILDEYERRKGSGKIDLSFYMDPLQAKKRIVCRLISYKRNKRILKEIPYRMFLDLAVVYYYLLEKEETGAAAILVRREHLRMWGMDEQALRETAEKNTRKLLPCDFLSMGDVMRDLMEPEEIRRLGLDERGREQTDVLYMLTNRQKSFGAVWMTDQAVLERIGERLKQDYYILPSSVHECMVVPVREGMEVRQLQEMVKEINETQVDPEEVLEDTVYHYSRSRGILQEAEAAER